jgi:hypothetical protein
LNALFPQSNVQRIKLTNDLQQQKLYHYLSLRS